MASDGRGPRRALRSPWPWAGAVVFGLVAAAVSSSAGWALGIGALVLLAVGGILAARPMLEPLEPRRPDSLPRAARTSPAGQLVARGEAAVNRIRQLSGSPGDPWLRDQIDGVDAEATEVLGALRDLAGRVTLVEQSLAVTDPSRLHAEADRLHNLAAQAQDPDVRAAREAAVAAVRDQLAVLDRLGVLREGLLARMEPAVLGLEGLAARMGEVVALGSGAFEHDRATELLGGLNADLESLRTGLEEAARVTDRELPPGPSAA